MTAEEQTAFLAGSKTLILSTIDGQGYPHSIAMWFSIIDGLVHMTTFRKAQKAGPKLTITAFAGIVIVDLPLKVSARPDAV